jgi:hypothetical protein
MLAGAQKRRVRPLEEGELDLVEAGTYMEVDLVHNAQDYCMRWPKSRLTHVVNASARSLPGGQLQGGSSEVLAPSRSASSSSKVAAEVAFGTVVHKPDISSTPSMSSSIHISGSWADAATEDESFVKRATFALPDAWLEPLGLGGEDDDSAAQTDEWWARYDACCTGVVSLEACVATTSLDTEPSIRRLMSVRQAAARVGIMSWRDGAPELADYGDALSQRLFDLWAAAREGSATAERPWGVPLVPEFFISQPRDEYFLPNHTLSARAAAAAWDPAVVAAKPWLKTKEGRTAVGGSKGRLGGAESTAAIRAAAATGPGPQRHGSTTTAASERTVSAAHKADAPRVVMLGERVAYVTASAAALPAAASGPQTRSTGPRLRTTGVAQGSRLDDELWYLPFHGELVAREAAPTSTSTRTGNEPAPLTLVPSSQVSEYFRKVVDGERKSRATVPDWHLGDLDQYTAACETIF